MRFVPEPELDRYCASCGAAWPVQTVGNARQRRCAACGRTVYRNPAVGVAVLLRESDTVLLGRRARGRYAGLWCVPCGYVEWDEDIRAAAWREVAEETGLQVEVGTVVAVHSNFHDRARQTVGVWFDGRVVGGVMHPGDDLDTLGYFALDRPPPLAFPTDAQVLAQLRGAARLP